jgi:hypothetical protein
MTRLIDPVVLQREVEAALQADPIILAMAEELSNDPKLGLAELTREDGHPNHMFMVAALREYYVSGGSIKTHLGGPANAILALLNWRRA